MWCSGDESTRNHEVLGSIPALSCGVGRRHCLDLGLWCRLAVVAPIRPLAWELPYAMNAALKKKKEKGKENTTLKLNLKVLEKEFYQYYKASQQ